MPLFNKKLFNFVKDAGEKLIDNIGGNEAQAAEKVQKRVKEEAKAENLDIKVQGEKVTINGKAASAEELERAVIAAGNVAGVGQVEIENVVSDNDDNDVKSEFYEVQSGDTLSGIAKKFYDDPNQYPKIFEANKPMLSDPDKIYPGQKLRIPEAKRAAA